MTAARIYTEIALPRWRLDLALQTKMKGEIEWGESGLPWNFVY